MPPEYLMFVFGPEVRRVDRGGDFFKVRYFS
jgi:hypothetical protein